MGLGFEPTERRLAVHLGRPPGPNPGAINLTLPRGALSYAGAGAHNGSPGQYEWLGLSFFGGFLAVGLAGMEAMPFRPQIDRRPQESLCA